MAETISLEVLRYSPEHDAEPSFQRYDVPVHKDWVVLDALNYIKDKVDGSLTFRWSCRMGICGSCGMMVNGEPKLTCATFLSDYARDGRPVRVQPWLIRGDEKPVSEGEYLQTPDQLDRYKQFSMCINCLLCYAACPVYGLDPVFIGPAAIALAQRYNMDSRDEGAHDRMDVLAQHEGIWGCTFVGECTQVCPKHVDPAGAIQQYKLTATIERFKSFLMPWSKNEAAEK